MFSGKQRNVERQVVIRGTRIKILLTLMCLSMLTLGSVTAFAADAGAKKSDAGLVKEMKSWLNTMRSQLEDAFKVLEESKAAKSFQRIELIQEAITAMKGLVRLAEQNLLGGQEAAAKGDRKTVEQTWLTVKVAAAKMKELLVQVRTEGKGVGAQAVEEGESQLQVTSQTAALTVGGQTLGSDYGDDGAPAESSQGQEVSGTSASGDIATSESASEPVWGANPVQSEAPSFEDPPPVSGGV
jgi:hypothetical protein